MAYIKAPIPSEVYHLTQQDKLDDILNDGKIRRFGDRNAGSVKASKR